MCNVSNQFLKRMTIFCNRDTTLMFIGENIVFFTPEHIHRVTVKMWVRSTFLNGFLYDLKLKSTFGVTMNLLNIVYAVPLVLVAIMKICKQNKAKQTTSNTFHRKLECYPSTNFSKAETTCRAPCCFKRLSMEAQPIGWL